MIKSYFKLAGRNLVRNKLASSINLFGLSTAIGCSVVMFAFVHYTYNQDSFHENAEAIFMVENTITLGGETNTWALTPVPLAPALKADFPQVKYAVRIENENASGTFRYQDKIFNEDFLFVDQDFFEMFTFPLKHGSKDALYDKNAVVLSHETAAKYFGEGNPVGEQMILKYGGQHTETLTVAGVAEDFPSNASLRFNILLPYEKRVDFGFARLNDWGAFTRTTFIQLDDPAEIGAVASGANQYIEWQNAAREDWHIEKLIFEPLPEAAINAYRVRGALFTGAHPAGTFAMGLIAFFLLSLACFNYVNIAIGSAARRLKEIGIRKVVGGNRSQLIKQFLAENVFLCFIALSLGVVLANILFLPGLNHVLNNFGITIPLNLTDNPALWAFLGGLLLITGVGAGLYPALYISAFRPVNIFRGQQKIGGRNLFTRVLLGFQFVFSFITIFAGITVSRNVHYLRGRDWGYDQAQTIVVPLDGKTQFEIFKNAISQDSNILMVAGSNGHIGMSSNSGLVKIDGQKYDVRRFQIGYDYPETMGLRLQHGRSFDRNMRTDLEDAILVNDTFVAQAGLTEPIGKPVIYEDRTLMIIGVVKDYHYKDFYQPIQPVLLQLTDTPNFQFLSVRVRAGAVAQTADLIEQTWQRLFPDSPYTGFFQDSVFDDFYRQNSARIRISGFMAGMTLLLSCMGLFGLATLNVAKRMKEFSIRKVLGATLFDITRVFNRDLFWLLAGATLVAGPISYVMMNTLLDAIFSYRISLDASLFIFSAASLFLTALLTVSSQIYRVVVSNPVDALRVE